MAHETSAKEPKLRHDLRGVIEQFEVQGAFVCARPFGSGHINDTYLVECRDDRGTSLYVAQRINHEVFRDPEVVMDNVERVTRHLRCRIGAVADIDRRVLTLVPGRDGTAFAHDGAGNCWRVYLHIADALTFDTVQDPGQAFQVARAFGAFQRQLLDLPGAPLRDTIPAFHDGEARFAAFQRAAEEDPVDRVAAARAEVDFAHSQEGVVQVLAEALRRGEIPLRTTHNDTKINNVLLDAQSGEALCVVDLDTVMPGLVHYDFGDLVRTLTCLAPEDETDLSNVHLEMDLFEAVARGYLEGADRFPTEREIDTLAFSGKFMTFVIGLRFLTDYLQGDRYFKVHRTDHNLDRARAQFALVRSISDQEAELDAAVRRFA